MTEPFASRGHPLLLAGLCALTAGACSSKSGGMPDARTGDLVNGEVSTPGDGRDGGGDALGDATASSDAQMGCGELDGRSANESIEPDKCTDSSPCGTGLLCGGFNCDMPWTCFAHDDFLEHPCPTDTAAYCGCDGVTFFPLDTCPDRPYEHVGACDDGVNCDPADLRCSQAEPSCPDGMLPSVVKGSYGPCVAVSACRCEFVFECPSRNKYTCDTSVRRCALVAATDAGQDGSSDGASDGASDSASDGGRRHSGVDPSKRIDQLTADERKTLCDFKASFYGGYGSQVNCGEGLALTGDDSLAACLAAWPAACAVAVSQLEQCSNDQSCDMSRPASCEPLLPCQ